jgi:hypothetical protein
MFDHSLQVRRINLPLFATFESVCAYVQRPCFNAHVICIYRPGSRAPADAFFTERTAIFSSPAIVLGDFNVHLDVATNSNAAKLLSMIESFGFQQHVKTPTHRCGHLLDLILTRPELCINVLPVDPPTLSDRSFVVAQLPMIASQPAAATTRVVLEWYRLDFDEFARDLAASDLFRSPPAVPDAAFELYGRTLPQLVDKHVPLTVRHVRLQRNTCWYDAECRAARRTTRQLEKLFRRCNTCGARQAWRSQFGQQRQLFQHKFATFWTLTIHNCKRDPRALWRTVQSLLKPSPQPTDQFAFCRYGSHVAVIIFLLNNHKPVTHQPICHRHLTRLKQGI